MLARRPALATGPEGVADMIKPEFGAITDPANDPASLAAVLRRYLDDPELAGARARPRERTPRRRYAAPVVAERLERLLS